MNDTSNLGQYQKRTENKKNVTRKVVKVRYDPLRRSEPQKKVVKPPRYPNHTEEQISKKVGRSCDIKTKRKNYKQTEDVPCKMNATSEDVEMVEISFSSADEIVKSKRTMITGGRTPLSACYSLTNLN